MRKIKTIHTSRTMMFSELEKVMAFSSDSNDFLESLNQNVTGKKSSSGVEKTAGYLKQLYGFDLKDPQFLALKYFWKMTEPTERPLLAFVFAVGRDNLLAESIHFMRGLKPGERASIELFEVVIESHHPNRYSPNTRRSMAQNIASSWKQAGFLEGKIKNIRVEPEISFKVACFAFLMAYLNGERGDFIWNSLVVNSLCSTELKLRELAMTCAKKDFMNYQFAGSVTAISFNTLLNRIGIDTI